MPDPHLSKVREGIELGKKRGYNDDLCEAAVGGSMGSAKTLVREDMEKIYLMPRA